MHLGTEGRPLAVAKNIVAQSSGKITAVRLREWYW